MVVLTLNPELSTNRRRLAERDQGKCREMRKIGRRFIGVNPEPPKGKWPERELLTVRLISLSLFHHKLLSLSCFPPWFIWRPGTSDFREKAGIPADSPSSPGDHWARPAIAPAFFFGGILFSFLLFLTVGLVILVFDIVSFSQEKKMLGPKLKILEGELELDN